MEFFFYSHVTVCISNSHTLYIEIVAQLYGFWTKIGLRNNPRDGGGNITIVEKYS